VAKNRAEGLPTFVFPVVAWAPEPATGDIGDDGIREFLTSRDVTRIHFPKTDLRRGWTFVDAEGRSWEVVSSRVTGRADAWWVRWLPLWLRHPTYRLAYDFAEGPAVSFDAVRSRLFAAVKSNPQAWRDYRRDRLEALRDAGSLHDLITSEEAYAIKHYEPVALWWQWLFWEGRCSRPAFLGAVLVMLVAGWAILTLDLPTLATVGLFILILMLGMSSVTRRLHDLRRRGWWIATWWGFSFLCACLHARIATSLVKVIAAETWQVVTLGLVGLLVAAPGTRGPNRYGPGGG